MNTQVYVGLGGNIGDTVYYLNKALEEIDGIFGVSNLCCSNFYKTTPVGPKELNDFVNAVCSFKTSLSAKELHTELQRIEVELGKAPKEKYHPRVIDLDLLFFGEDSYNDAKLHIPHLSWNDRLFVLIPLSELLTDITVNHQTFNIPELLKIFPNRHQEIVTFLTKPQNQKVCK